MDDDRNMADPFHATLDPCAEQSLGSEERHLRVVGGRADLPIRGLKLANSLRAEGRADLSEPHELDGGAERIAQRPAEKATSDVLSVSTHLVGEVLSALRTSFGSMRGGPVSKGQVLP